MQIPRRSAWRSSSSHETRLAESSSRSLARNPQTIARSSWSDSHTLHIVNLLKSASTFPAPVVVYFLVTSVRIVFAACWIRGVKTSSPSDLALPFSEFSSLALSCPVGKR